MSTEKWQLTLLVNYLQIFIFSFFKTQKNKKNFKRLSVLMQLKPKKINIELGINFDIIKLNKIAKNISN